ncbi:Putative protein without homology [Lacticaseibacillus rhamnosus GG]|nr:Putative protein without homology [Lacticaseibacillus rhamnosus GG]
MNCCHARQHVVAQSIKNPDLLKINVWVFNYRQGVQINYTQSDHCVQYLHTVFNAFNHY